MADTFEKTPDGKLKRIKTVAKEEIFDLSELRAQKLYIETERDRLVASYVEKIKELGDLIREAERLQVEN
jgi:hypothetical protein